MNIHRSAMWSAASPSTRVARWLACCAYAVTLCISFCVSAAEPTRSADSTAPLPISAEEALAANFSIAAAANYLDRAALDWEQTHRCTSCHTMVSYMMARGALASIAPAPPQVRQFFEDVAAGTRQAMPDYGCDDIEAGISIVVATSLSLSDRMTSGRLHPLTRTALDRMWTFQRADGGWQWPFRDTPPIKAREHYAATLAAIAAGMAPDDYARTEPALSGLNSLRTYLQTHPPETLHEEAMLIWAASFVNGLTTDESGRESIGRLLAAQRPDGGWSLASLVENPSAPATVAAEEARRLRSAPGHGSEFLVYSGRDAAYKSVLASDGYATGFAIYVSRTADIPASDERLIRGINWLKKNQRASGRWFTPSQAWHSQHLIANAGTAYAVLALAACGEVPDALVTP